jgi:glycosyltransferase involved in cell wall biosynthesis
MLTLKDLSTAVRSTNLPRKILLVLEATLGGTGRHILDLARGLLERDNEVHLIYSDLRADVQFQRGLERLRTEWPEFRSERVRISRAVTVSDVAAFWRLFRYLRRHGPFDIIHGHSTKAGFLARLTPGVRGAATIYTPHALLTMDPALRGVRRWAVSVLETFLAGLSNKIIVVSRDEWRCALETGIPERKLVLIENGVDLATLARRATKREEIRTSLGVPREAACVGFIGRLTEQKKPARVLEAFAIVARKAALPVKLALIGYGPFELALKARAAELGLERDVIWAGPLDGAAYVAGFDVLALSSLYEGFSYVFLEALASGVPFVSTRVSMAEELAQGGGAGFVCEPWEPAQFAELVLRILEDPSLHASLSEAARKVAARFDVGTMIDKTCHVYDAAAPPRRDTREPDMHTPAANSV